MLHSTIRSRVGMAILIGFAPLMAACQVKVGGNAAAPVTTASALNGSSSSPVTPKTSAPAKPKTQAQMRALLSADDSTLTFDQRREKAILQAKIGGTIALKQNKHKAADQLFSLGLALDPENHELLAGRAVTLQLMNRHREAIPVLDKFHAVSKTKDQVTQALALRMLAENRYSLSRRKEAMRFFEQALEKYPAAGNEVSRIDIMGKLGAMHEKEGDLAQAERYLTRARNLAEQHNNQQRIIDIRIKQGRLLRKSGKLVAAETAFRETLRLSEDGGFEKHAASSLANLGLLAKEEMQYKQAIDYLTRAAERYGKAKNAKIGEAYTYGHLAQIHNKQGRLAEAEKLFDRSSALFRRMNLHVQVAGNLIYTGHIALKTNNLPKACDRWRQADKIYEKYKIQQERLVVGALTATMCKDVGLTS